MIDVIDDSPAIDSNPPGSEAIGEIRIGEFSETFLMSLLWWSVDDYRRSWELALRRIDESNNVTSCLLTSVTDPVATNFVTCWPMYREGEDIYVHNMLMFLDELDEVFNEWEPWRYVGERYSVNEDGDSLSEWLTSASEVRRFREETWGL